MSARRNFGNPDWRYSDEENFFDLEERAKRVLAYISDRKEDNVAVVAHGTIIRMMVFAAIMGQELTPAVFKKIDEGFATYNTGITKLKFDTDRWRLLTWNDHAHLGEVG